MRKTEIQKIKLRYPEGSVIEVESLNRFINTELEFSNPKSRSFVIFDLTSKNVLYQLNATHFKMSSRKTFKLDLPQTILPELMDLGSQYPNLKICAWELKSLNHFLEMQVLKNVTFIEVEKSFESLVMERLSQSKQGNLVFKPSPTQYETYSAFDSLVIIKTLISKAPVNKKRFSRSVGFNRYYHGDKNSLSTPKIEKIIVDLLVDPFLGIFDDSQRDLMIKNILNDYAVNFKTLFSYARNRNKKEFIQDYLKNILRFNIENGEFYDQ